MDIVPLDLREFCGDNQALVAKCVTYLEGIEILHRDTYALAFDYQTFEIMYLNVLGEGRG